MTDDVVPWWLWPNVLALDAPVVAVVWQRFLADTFGVGVPAVASVILGLVVWGIYLADRFLDARKGDAAQPRHRFACRNPAPVSVLAIAALGTGAALALLLPVAYLRAGGVTVALVAGYLAVFHLVRVPIANTKEMLVGVLFATGVSVPLIASDAPPAEWLPAATGFGLVCWLNCLLIDRWESAAAASGLIPVLLLGVLATAALAPFAGAVALASAGALLLGLHAVRDRTGPQLARALADAVLLTPILAWPLV